MEWLPEDNTLLVRMALLPIRVIGAPIRFPLSVKVTGPVGDTPVTVAVNVTGCPTTEGFGEELRETLVLPGLIVCTSADETLPRYLASPA